jgi:hypothetical protein
MAGAFPPDAPLLAKRQDGSTILLKINPMEGLTELQERVARHEVGGNCSLRQALFFFFSFLRREARRDKWIVYFPLLLFCIT